MEYQSNYYKLNKLRRINLKKISIFLQFQKMPLPFFLYFCTSFFFFYLLSSFSILLCLHGYLISFLVFLHSKSTSLLLSLSHSFLFKIMSLYQTSVWIMIDDKVECCNNYPMLKISL